MYKNFIFILVLFSFTLLHANNKLEILVEDEWPPYSNLDGSGISNSLLKTAYDEVDIRSSFKIMPFARIKTRLKAGVSVLGINFGDVHENRVDYLFGKEPLFTIGSHYYILKDSKYKKMKSMKELNSSIKVGIIIGYDYGDFIDLNKNNINLSKVATQVQNLEKLKRKRVDMIIIYDDVAQEVIKKHNLEGLVEKAFKGESLDIYAAFSKKHKKSAYYMNKLDLGLSVIKKNGKYERIFNSCANKELRSDEVLCIKP